MTRVRRAGAVAGLTIAAALLAGCSALSPGATGTPPASPSATAHPDAAPAPTTEPTTAAEPACDTIIPDQVVKDFAASGWTFQRDVFRIGATEVPDGIQCTWGDYTVASDHVQIFGWAPIDSETALDAQQQLVAEGWRRVDGSGGVYITEDPSTALGTDSDGFGMTYLFGDGWVTVSDTKQGLLLVDWPPQ